MFYGKLASMKILTVDIGTGTQDVLLCDSRLEIENSFKLVLPSPTLNVNRRIKEATKSGVPILLTGVTMGGGPSGWAVQSHLRLGLAVYATPEAARTLDDDLERVASMGVRVLSEDEAQALPSSVLRVRFLDFDYPLITDTFTQFGVSLDDLAAVAVAVFDHGAAPPGISDRQFRFDYLNARIREKNALTAFAYLAEDIPPVLTRMRSVANSFEGVDLPLVVMDTAPAAVLGAGFDPAAATLQRKIIVNVGNFHTLAFRMGLEEIEGLFEHHTGEIDLPKLERLVQALAEGSLEHQHVFDDHGHGALVYTTKPLLLGQGDFDVIVTGPRRSLLRGSALRPYFAVPFGDMMMSGNVGLLAATADLLPHLADPILASLEGRGSDRSAPWDLEE